MRREEKKFDEIFDEMKAHIENNKVDELVNGLEKYKNSFDINHVRTLKKFDNTESAGREKQIIQTNSLTLLHKAIMKGAKEIVSQLINCGSDINKEACDYEEITEYQNDSYTGSRTYISSNKPTKYLYSPVELACKLCQFEIVFLLYIKGGRCKEEKTITEYLAKMLKTRGNELQPQLIELSRKNSELQSQNSELQRREKEIAKFFTGHEDYYTNIVYLQTAIRSKLARSCFHEKKAVYFEETEKIGLDIMEKATKKRRFDDTLSVSNIMTKSNSIVEMNEQLQRIYKKGGYGSDKRYILLLGEGNFSFAVALFKKLSEKQKNVEKYKNVSFMFIVSDILTLEQLEKTHREKFRKNRDFLLSKKESVKLLEKVDAASIDTDPRITQTSDRFHKIYFNGPHDGKPIKISETPKLIPSFFNAAAKLQKTSDKIHIILQKDKEETKRGWRQAKFYGLYDSSTNAGYVYRQVNADVATKYPGYDNTQTNRDEAFAQPEDLREHMFEKSYYSTKVIKSLHPPTLFENKNCIPEISTPPGEDTLSLSMDSW